MFQQLFVITTARFSDHRLLLVLVVLTKCFLISRISSSIKNFDSFSVSASLGFSSLITAAIILISAVAAGYKLKIDVPTISSFASPPFQSQSQPRRTPLLSAARLSESEEAELDALSSMNSRLVKENGACDESHGIHSVTGYLSSPGLTGRNRARSHSQQNSHITPAIPLQSQSLWLAPFSIALIEAAYFRLLSSLLHASLISPGALLTMEVACLPVITLLCSLILPSSLNLSSVSFSSFGSMAIASSGLLILTFSSQFFFQSSNSPQSLIASISLLIALSSMSGVCRSFVSVSINNSFQPIFMGLALRIVLWNSLINLFFAASFDSYAAIIESGVSNPANFPLFISLILFGLLSVGVDRHASPVDRAWISPITGSLLLIINYYYDSNSLSLISSLIILFGAIFYFSSNNPVSNSNSTRIYLNPGETNFSLNGRTRTARSPILIAAAVMAAFILPFILFPTFSSKSSIGSLSTSEHLSMTPTIISLSPVRLRDPLIIHARNLPLIYFGGSNVRVGEHLCRVERSGENFIQCSLNWDFYAPLGTGLKGFNQTQNLLINKNNSQISSPPVLPEIASLIVTIDHQSFNRPLVSAPLIFRRIVNHWERNNIALVIHFNAPYNVNERAPFLRQQYSKLFPRVIIVAGEQLMEVDVLCEDGTRGWHAYMCLARAMQVFPMYGGYLQTHLDCLPNFANLEKFNSSQIWQLQRWWMGLKNETHTQQWPPPENGWNWHREHPNMERVQEMIVNYKNFSQKYQKYYTNYIHNLGSWDLWQSGPVDAHYVPGRLRDDFVELARREGILTTSNLFLECAYHFITACITSDMSSEWREMYGAWMWRPEGDLLDQFWFRTDWDYFHPAQLHTGIGQAMVIEQIRRALPDYQTDSKRLSQPPVTPPPFVKPRSLQPN